MKVSKGANAQIASVAQMRNRVNPLSLLSSALGPTRWTLGGLNLQTVQFQVDVLQI